MSESARRPLTLDLALQGGGCKGIALNAALAEVMRRGHVIRRIVGTSAGAIAASLVAAGYTGDELVEMASVVGPDGKLQFAEYVTEPVVPASPEVEPVITGLQSAALRLPGDLGQRLLGAAALLSVLETGGISSGEGLVSWLTRKLEAKGRGLSRVTLGELHASTGRHLTIFAADITSRRLRAINHRTAPACPLVAAVRMSMSIPLLFAEVVWREEWGRYLGESLTGHAMVDGGLTSNLPLTFILPGASALVAQLMGPPPPGPGVPIGLSIDTSLEVKGAPPPPQESSLGSRLSNSKVGQRLHALIDTMLLGNDLTFSDTGPTPLCLLPAKGYSAAEFDMTLDRALALLASARTTTARYLDALEARVESAALA
ncbi:MAG: patatin-like phospholipase family protein [Myxococcota bacterium]